MNINSILEKFNKTSFAQKGGQFIECCDYEGMDNELRDFIRQSITEAPEAVKPEKATYFPPVYNSIDEAYSRGIVDGNNDCLDELNKSIQSFLEE